MVNAGLGVSNRSFVDRTRRSRAVVERRDAGFNVFELLVVLVLLAIAATFGAPASIQMFSRTKLQGATNEVAAHLQMARLEAMKLGRTVVVAPDYTARRLFSYRDENDNLSFDAGVDRVVFNLPVPADAGRSGVLFMGPDGIAGTALAPAQSIEGLTLLSDGQTRAAVFQRDGSIRHPGAFRFADGKQPRANVLEVRVAPQATARVEVRKYVEDSFQSYGSGLWQWY
jgi:prepilin-type N-terminal cleavage/methylation domain-containing protein